MVSHRRRLLQVAVCAGAVLAPAASGRRQVREPSTRRSRGSSAPATRRPRETYLNILGANPLGMRLAGTEAEQAASRYVAAELQATSGLQQRAAASRCRWTRTSSRGAIVTVGARGMTASQFPGIPGTPPRGHHRRASYTSTTAPRPTSMPPVTCTGKVVLVDLEPGGGLAELARRRGHASRRPGRGLDLRSEQLPLVRHRPGRARLQRRRVHGRVGAVRLRLAAGRRLAQGPARGRARHGRPSRATWRSRRTTSPIRRPEASASTWSAELPGTSPDAGFVLVTSHIGRPLPLRPRRHGRAGLRADHGQGHAAERRQAEAHGGVPVHVREEYGYGNAYFDYLAGSWWAISHSHPDVGRRGRRRCSTWSASPGRVRRPSNTAPELAPWLRRVAAENARPAALGTRGLARTRARGTTAGRCSPPASRPSRWRRAETISGSATTRRGRPRRPSTGAYLRQAHAVRRSPAAQLDRGVLRTIWRRGHGASGRRSSRRCWTAPASTPPTCAGSCAPPSDFQEAANRFSARSSRIRTSHLPRVNRRLLGVVKDIETNLTGLSAWEDTRRTRTSRCCGTS